MLGRIRDLYLMLLIPTALAVILEGRDESTLNSEDPESFGEAFGACMAQKEYGTFECVNRGALSALQSLNERDELDFGEMQLERAEGFGRELLDLNYEPKDFGNIVKAAATLMERRSFKWNLDNLYPGLQLRAGPMLNGNGLLEFVINERAATYTERQAGTGRQLARHLLLPFLLGFKFSLASLIPLLFGFLLVITKKALLLTKVALFISGLLGWNTIFSMASNNHPGSLNGFNGFHPYQHEGPIAGFPYQDHHHPFPHRPFRVPSVQEFSPYGQHVIREVVNVYGTEESTERNKRSGKNFVWTKNG